VENFVAGPTNSTLSFYWRGHCHDYLYGGYARATLKDVTTGATTTILPNNCTRSPSWNLVQASVTPSHNYTLSLISHDDGYGGLNPNWTDFDEVKLLG
jgi:hypothetical protein